MISYGLLVGGAVYAASGYYELKQTVDCYPEKLGAIVKKIKGSIDSKTYEFLTNQDCDEDPKNSAIEGITGGDTKVVKFKDCPDFVVKTSRIGLRFDIARKFNGDLSGGDYSTTNNEGGVTRDLFRYAKRVIVAKKLRRIIKDNHLDKIQIPKKYLCSYPEKLTSRLSTPFYNRLVFILCEKCDVEYVGEKTREELQKMSKSEMEILANQIHTFFSKAGVLDFFPHNYYIKHGKLVIFDTEPMSLAPLHLLCVSPTLRVARINFKNLERNFSNIPEAKTLVDEAKRSITQIRTQERERFPRAVCITFVFFGVLALLNYFALLPLRKITITI